MISIGVAQIANSLEVEKNFQTILSFLTSFKKEGVDFVVFPKCGLSGFWFKGQSRTQFYKLGLTDSEQKFFATPEHETQKGI